MLRKVSRPKGHVSRHTISVLESYSLIHLAFYTQGTSLHKANSFHTAALNTITIESSFLYSFSPASRAWVRIAFESLALSLGQVFRVIFQGKIFDTSPPPTWMDQSAICVFDKLWGCCDRGLWFLDGFLCRNVRQGFLMDFFAGTWGSGLTFYNTPGEVRKELEDPLSWVFLGFLMKFSDAVN